MSLFAIGDLHLALGAPEKNMSVFGGKWTDYEEKLRGGFERVGADDTTVICGDLSWAMDLEGALPDFRFLDELPGKKLLLKGNHDYWWNTAKKIGEFFVANGLTSLSLLHNNCAFYEDVALCGTRGWFYEEESGKEHDEKILRRELGRLETSLKAAGEREKIVFLHYPPVFRTFSCPPILDLLEKYGVKECLYGHLHGKGCAAAFTGERNGTNFRLISADSLEFIPFKLR